jgi:hypothetical protein
MSLSDGYRRLAALIDEIEGDGVVVTRSEPGREGTAQSEGRLTATLTVEIPLDGDDTGATDPRPAGRSVAEADEAETAPGTGSAAPGPAAKAPAAGSDEDPGGAVMSREADDGPTADAGPKVGPVGGSAEARTGMDDANDTSTGRTGDDQVPCEHADCDETFGSEHGMRIHHSKTHRGEGTAPHRDPDQLRRVYDEHDTFAEMRDALGVPVASNTVRRQLIDHGIHDPSASGSDEDGIGSGSEPTSEEVDGAGAEDETSGRAVSDGGRAGGPVPARGDGGSSATEPSGPDGPDVERNDELRRTDDELSCEIAEGVGAGELRNALADASTVYDVQSALDLERDATMNLLSEVELLSVVHGRVATKRDRDEQRAEIDERIRSYVERASD